MTFYPVGPYSLEWEAAGKSYDVYYYGRKDQHVCRVFPYKGEEGTIGQASKMFTVKATEYPGIGSLEQMVKGADLLEYIDSIRMGRGM
jgi:hypothetical protein